jgi:hypothetical protein
MMGVRAAAIAFASVTSRYPHPSKIISTTGEIAASAIVLESMVCEGKLKNFAILRLETKFL